MSTEDIRTLSAEFARNPTSLVFLTLGEALRKRGQLGSAERVVRAGLERHPRLADAHALLGRILTDRYDFEQAFEAWSTVLTLVPEHSGAHQGLGFLYFRAGELERALGHLEEAARLAPDDRAVRRGLETVRAFAEEQAQQARDAASTPSAVEQPADSAEAARPATPQALFAGLEGAERSVILLDRQGRLLAGGLAHPDGTDVTERVAAFLAGVSHECERAARVLELGAWTGLSAEAEAGHVHLVQPTGETLLVLARDRSVPLGRIAFLAERAAAAARRWLENGA